VGAPPLEPSPGRAPHGPRGHRCGALLRRPDGAGRGELRGRPRCPDRPAGTERRGKDDPHARDAGCAGSPARGGAFRRASRGGGHPTALGLHAAGARPLPGHAGRRAGRLLRPAARALAAGRGAPSQGAAGGAGTARPVERADGQAVRRYAAAPAAGRRSRPRPGGHRARRALRGTGPRGCGQPVGEPASADSGRSNGAVLEPPAGPGPGPLPGHHHDRPGAHRAAGGGGNPARLVRAPPAPPPRELPEPGLAAALPGRGGRQR
jgi:hypothetical protein